MTRRTLYMCPSKVQLVRSRSFTRSRRPSARSASSVRLTVASGTAPYIEYSVIGNAST